MIKRINHRFFCTLNKLLIVYNLAMGDIEIAFWLAFINYLIADFCYWKNNKEFWELADAHNKTIELLAKITEQHKETSNGRK